MDWAEKKNSINIFEAVILLETMMFHSHHPVLITDTRNIRTFEVSRYPSVVEN